MTQLLALDRPYRVLKIGIGSGYQAAGFPEVADIVCSLEALAAPSCYAAAAVPNCYVRIALRQGDGNHC